MLSIPIWATVVSGFLLWWGWYQEGDGSPFSRSGALVSAVAVVFIFWQYAKVLAERELLIRDEVRESLRKRDIAGRAAEKISGEIADDVHSDSVSTDRLITYWQGFLLITGTIVWGFGDLAVQVKKVSWSEIVWRFLHLGAPLSS
jgi:hypothetical protein